MTGGLILAAGGGSRFGGRKQLAELRGRPLLEYAIEAMSATPAIERILVVLGSEADEVLGAIDFRGVETTVCEGWDEGIAASLRTGVEALSDCEAIVITLGDQPFITPRAIEAIADRAGEDSAAVRAVYDGEPGHPVLIKRTLYPRVAELRGDAGARDLLVEAGAIEVECGALCPPDDVDTPTDLETARERLG
jgi:molybdenum cofactor cytidylyltransferase